MEVGTFGILPYPTAWAKLPGVEMSTGADPKYNAVQPYVYDTTIGAAEVEASTPIPVSPALVPASFMISRDNFEDSWWEMAHLLPRLEQDIGNVVSEQVIDVELHNADRSNNLRITSITDNLGTGIYISGVPSTPFEIIPQHSITPQITIQRSGDLVIDASYTFHDSEGGSYTVNIVGSRIVMFPVRPESPFKETLKFKTEVLTKLDGSEQRRSIIKTPRTEFMFTIKGSQNRQQTEFVLFDRQSKAVALPMWHEPAFLTDATVPSGTTVINVKQTAYRNFYVGGYAVILQDEFTYDALEIVAMDATSITTKSGIEHNYDGNIATVMPMALSYFAPKVTTTKHHRDVQTFKVRMTVDAHDNDIADASAWSTFNGKVLMDEPNFMSSRSGMKKDIETKTYDATTAGSLISKYAIWDRSKGNSFKGFKTNNRQELWELRQLLHYLRGMQTSFYLPTFMDEITATSKLIVSNSSLQMRNIGYTRNVQDRAPKDYLRIHLKDGTLLERTVIGSAEQDKDYEQITVDVVWPYDIEVDDIDYIEFLEKVRINVDDVTIMHYNALGQADCTVPVIEVFD